MDRKMIEINIDWVTTPGDPSFNSMVIKELKGKGIDFEYDHFFNLRAHNYDLKVNEHTKVEDRVRYIKSFESLEYDEKTQEIFKNEVDDAIKNFDSINAIKVCDTPLLLLDIGFEQKPWLYSKKHLNDAITPSCQGGHGLSRKQIYNMAEKIEKPCFVLKNRNEKRQDCPIIIFDDVNDEKLPLFLAVQKDGKGNYNFKEIDCNFIKSLYGHDAFERYLNSVIKNNGLIYYDKEKVHNLETLAGV